MIFTWIMSSSKKHNRRPPRGPEPGPERLASLMNDAGIALDERQIKQLWAFHSFLREKNRELNMTRIHNFENIVLKHFVDCMMVARLVDLPSPLIDIGSGPGFPGIPLKIVRPDLRLVLAEGRARRAEFLEDVVGLLGFDGVHVYGHKVGPANNPAKDLGIAFEGAITRALEEIPGSLRRVLPLIEEGGRLLLMKGPECDDELAEAARIGSGAYRLEKDIPYALPGSSHRRRLCVFVKIGDQLPSRREAPAPAYDGPVKEITSETNPTFRSLLGLHTARGIRKSGQALIAGTRPVAEVIAQKPELCRAWITPLPGKSVSEDLAAAAPPTVATAATSSALTWLRLSPALFKALDLSGTHSPLLLTDRPPLDEWSHSARPEGCTLFVPFQDPENVGAVIRTAAAFGVSALVLLKEAANPFLPRAQRAAGSALFRINMYRGPSIRDLETARAPMIVLSQEGRDLATYDFPPAFGLLVGMEGPGLPDSLRIAGEGREVLSIPMEGGAESLNAASATAIGLYCWHRQRRKKKAGAP